jgi:hypothetical protein
MLALLGALLVLPLALAPRAEAFVYWANGDKGTIGRANLDGTGIDERFIIEGPTTVTVDAQHIYWGGGGSAAETADPKLAINRARLDGTQVDRTFIPVRIAL